MGCIRKKIELIITEELGKANIHIPWDMREIHALPNSDIVIEQTSSNGILSEGLIEHLFPAIRDPIELAHFTKIDNLKSILTTGELRLYTILKRLNEQEFKPFAEAHRLNGYLDNGNGKPYYMTLMEGLFYSSFTKVMPSNEQYMWNIFAAGRTGVKIVFKVTPILNRVELRPVFYHSQATDPITVLKNLSDRIFNDCGRHFIMKGISRIGAFYLPLGLGLEMEEEKRLLIKSYGSGPAFDMIIGTGDNAYIPLKIGPGQNNFCEIEISEIQIGSYGDKSDLEKVLAQVGRDDIPVSIFN